MAAPVLELYDDTVTLVAAALPFAGVVPGTPTAETEVSLRNNHGGGAAVDTAYNVKLRGYSRVDGSANDPVASGLPFQDARALQVRVKSVSGGATAQVTSWRPLGAGNSLNLATIPDGGVVTLGLRISAPTAAGLQDIDAFIDWDIQRTTPLPSGWYEGFGNVIYTGAPGGSADPTFSQIRSVGDTAIAPNSPADDTILLPQTIRYAFVGVDENYPTGGSLTFTNLDGDAAALGANEAYFAALTLGAGSPAGSGLLTVTRGSKNTAPLTDADRPTLPADEILYAYITVPFGLAIDATEIDERTVLGFFGQTAVSGLNVTIGYGTAFVGGFLVETETETSITLTDNQDSTIWVLPSSGSLEEVATGTDPSESRAMPIWRYVTASGAITDTVDLRVFDQTEETEMSVRMNRFQQLFGADYLPTEVLYEERQTWGACPLLTDAYRELTPISHLGTGVPKLTTADSTISLEVASDDAQDDDTTGTGAWQVRSVVIGPTFAESVVTTLLDGTTEATIAASAYGIQSSQIIAVGSGGAQAGNVAFGDGAGGWTAGVPATYLGRIPLVLGEAPLTGGSPAGLLTGLVQAVPLDHVAAIAKLTILSEGPAFVELVATRATGTYVLWSGPVGAGATSIELDAPQWINSDGAPAGIPDETWISLRAVSLGAEDQYISGRMDWILEDLS